jgi:GTP cyclohydrolase II
LDRHIQAGIILPKGRTSRMPASHLTLPAATGAPNREVLALRSVHRAISELRRGTPVLLQAPGAMLVVAAAETVGAQGLAELQGVAAGPTVLLLAPVRASAVLSRPVPLTAPETGAVALRLPPSLFNEVRLRSFADPTVAQFPGGEGGALERAPAPALAVAAIALAKLARLLPALVAAPALDGAATLLRVAEEEVLAYPATAATSLRRVAEARVPLAGAAETRIVAFRAAEGGIEHLAMLVGDPERVLAAGGAPLARIHSECFTGDLLGSLRCDCGPQLHGALRRMAQKGAGVLLYLAQEGRGIGLVNKLRAYALQDDGLDTLDANRALGYGADERNFLVAGTMLQALGIPRVRLLTNNPDKLAGLAACGIEVVSREPHAFGGNGVNDAYLATKAERFGHMF